jgi:microfibrillar-associated protein 1
MADDPTRFLAGKIRPPKQRRQYRAGQAPDSDQSDSDDNEAIEKKSMASFGTLRTIHTVPTAALAGTDLRSTVIKAGFTRPGDIKKSSGIDKNDDMESEIGKDARKATENEIKAEKPEERILETEEVEVVSRRRRPVQQVENSLKQSAEKVSVANEPEEHLGKRKPLERLVVDKEKEVEKMDIEDEGSEEEVDNQDDSEDEIFPSGQRSKMTRPVFISQPLRQIETLSEVEQARQDHDKLQLQSSIADRNMSLAVESKKEREDAVDNDLSDSEVDLPNDSTEDEDTAYDKWKVRELARLKRDREEREKLFKEKEAIERRRMMTDEERAKDDKRIGKYKEDQKSHYRFMQKFYSKGIFHIDDDDPLFKRDYNMAVGEDLFDKSVLPGIRQTRRGEQHKKGKSKYTHLVAEDTTNFDPDWMTPEELHNKHKMMTAGYKNAALFERPSKRR